LALSQYQEIIDHHNDGIYIDEALFFSAEIYNEKLKERQGQAIIRKIIFNHEDSIYLWKPEKTSGNWGDINLKKFNCLIEQTVKLVTS
jgi:hypothetical protein